MFNKIRATFDKTIRRKNNYLKSRLLHFRKNYEDLVNEKIKNDKLKSIAYTIMIYEDFNRPKVARLAENIRFKITGKEYSLGLMQVQNTQFISDKKSIELGLDKIKKTYNKQLKERELDKSDVIDALLPGASHIEWSMELGIIGDYNKGESYAQEVRSLVEKIFELSESKNKTYLFPKYKGEETKQNSEEEE